MADLTGGMGAEVGVRKIDSDGVVTEERGTTSAGRLAYLIFYLMLVLSGFGIWKIFELIFLLA